MHFAVREIQKIVSIVRLVYCTLVDNYTCIYMYKHVEIEKIAGTEIDELLQQGIHSFHSIRRTEVQNRVIITCHNNRRVQTNGMEIARPVGEHRGLRWP